ncbi:Uncharacterized protein APZ42_023207 [Daphnia magna]|uniref:Uncharacterized protein n=1 Tax=Daphnia magna TaxID=35525 RepID=A0A164V4T5_9CRUS|nr:Uncharacterized protein APZ42_023207 [Daphnia magna]
MWSFSFFLSFLQVKRRHEIRGKIVMRERFGSVPTSQSSDSTLTVAQ